MNAGLAIVAAFTLSGCSMAERLANGATVEPSGEVIEPNGAVIEPNGEVIPSPVELAAESLAAESELGLEKSGLCLVRAKHFRGLVRIPCDQIARETAP
jgi:hypothetical protein